MNDPLTPEQIVAAREAAGLTQEAAAEAADIPLRSYQAYERGEREPKSKRAAAIRKALRMGTNPDKTTQGKFEPLADERFVNDLRDVLSSNRDESHRYNPEEYMEAPITEIIVSAGDGANVPEPKIVGHDLVLREEAASLFSYDAENGLRFRVRGDSMVPEHLDGERVFVEPINTMQSPPDGKYIFLHDGMVYLKRLQFKPRGIVAVKSVSPSYDPWEINLREEPDSFRLLFRVRDTHKQAMLYAAYAAIFRPQVAHAVR